MIRKTFLTLMAAAGLTIAAPAKQIRVSTVAQVERTFSKAKWVENSQWKLYTYNGHIIDVGYDAKGICLASSTSPQSSSICNHTLARGDLLGIPAV